MTYEHDPLEQELAALRPAEPSAELAERIEARLAADGATRLTKAGGTRSVLSTYWLVSGGVLAAMLLAGLVWWSNQKGTSTVDIPFDPAQATLADALDDALPSVWSFRPALSSPAALESLLDEHAAPNAGGHPVQTRGFVPVTMNLNSRLGEL